MGWLQGNVRGAKYGCCPFGLIATLLVILAWLFYTVLPIHLDVIMRRAAIHNHLTTIVKLPYFGHFIGIGADADLATGKRRLMVLDYRALRFSRTTARPNKGGIGEYGNND